MMNVHDLDTPALIVDLDIMERNLRRVADYARAHGLRLRPHTKTHKTPALGRMQLALGAAGLTVAKVGEAEVMAATGTPDLLVAYPVLGERKLARLMEVARRTSVTVALDSSPAAQQLSEAAAVAGVRIGVLAEMDAGLHRVGVDPGAPLLELVQEIERLPRLEWRGIAFYPGHIKTAGEGADLALEELSGILRNSLTLLRANGLDPAIISGGSTPTLFRSHEVAGLNEIRPGTYIFNDRNTVACGACSFADCAATILTTVVSTARAGQFIIDGGSKTFSSDRLVTGGDDGFGQIVGMPGAHFVKMNEEHGFVSLASGSEELRVGDRIQVVPNHICVAVNLHETIYGVRGERVEEAWKVEARGKLQ